MKCMEITEQAEAELGTECVIQMPLGLLGFERFKRFVLTAHPGEEPFLRLRSAEDPNLAFLVLSPFVVVPDYQADIAPEDVEFLGLQSASDMLVFNIVTTRGAQATINLKGPIALNRTSLVAKQVIPLNAPGLSVAHPLPLQSN